MMVAGHFSALLHHRWDGAITRPKLEIRIRILEKKKLEINECTTHQQRPSGKTHREMVQRQMPALPPSRAHQHATFMFMLNMKG